MSGVFKALSLAYLQSQTVITLGKILFSFMNILLSFIEALVFTSIFTDCLLFALLDFQILGYKKPGMVVHTCNPSTQEEAETGRCNFKASRGYIRRPSIKHNNMKKFCYIQQGNFGHKTKPAGSEYFLAIVKPWQFITEGFEFLHKTY